MCSSDLLNLQKFDVITSRAMTSLNDLFGYAFRFCKKNTVLIFPKGKKYLEEISQAQKFWNFEYQANSSEVSDEGKILVISNLSKRKGDKNA